MNTGRSFEEKRNSIGRYLNAPRAQLAARIAAREIAERQANAAAAARPAAALAQPAANRPVANRPAARPAANRPAAALARPVARPATEDDQLAAAILASMEQHEIDEEQRAAIAVFEDELADPELADPELAENLAWVDEFEAGELQTQLAIHESQKFQDDDKNFEVPYDAEDIKDAYAEDAYAEDAYAEDDYAKVLRLSLEYARKNELIEKDAKFAASVYEKEFAHIDRIENQRRLASWMRWHQRNNTFN
jgi:hypothetical protein